MNKNTQAEKEDMTAVRKNLSIPKRMDDWLKENEISLSFFVQECIKIAMRGRRNTHPLAEIYAERNKLIALNKKYGHGK